MENPISNPNDGLSTTSIADLLDNELTEIFIRLPCFETVITCKFVSKHWLSLLSNPKFVIQFVKHKEKKKNGQKGLPWTVLSLARHKLIINDDSKTAKSFIDAHNKVFYSSSKFSMKFLPLPLQGTFKVAATFRDLILCINISHNDNRYNYYICNPVTKSWVALPPTSTLLDYDHDRSWACLTCEDPYYQTETEDNNNNNNNIDGYRFRIVVIPFPTKPVGRKRPYDNDPFTTLNATVFCSDNSQWIDIDVRVPLNPRKSEPVRSLKGVLCKGMVCVCSDLYFGMFNPFDVTPTTTGLEARVLPIPPNFARSKILECGGRLISVLPAPLMPTYHKDKVGNLLVDYEAGIRVKLLYKELDLNQLVGNNNNEVEEVSWKEYGGVICIDKTGRSRSVFSGIRMINIHPRNNHLLFILTAANELLLCDRRSSSLKTLGRCELHPDLDLDQDQLHSSKDRLYELQHWPTPVPIILPSIPN